MKDAAAQLLDEPGPSDIDIHKASDRNHRLFQLNINKGTFAASTGSMPAGKNRVSGLYIEYPE